MSQHSWVNPSQSNSKVRDGCGPRRASASLANGRAGWSPVRGSRVPYPTGSGTQLLQLLLASSSQPPTLLLPQLRSSHPSLPAGLPNCHLSPVPATRETCGLKSGPFGVVLREGWLLKCEPEYLQCIYWPLELICPLLDEALSSRHWAAGLLVTHCPPLGCVWLCPEGLSPTCLKVPS